MERRFAVHAGAHQQKVSTRGVALVAAVVFATTPALAAPKAGEARVQFDRGVAAYTKGDYAAAAEALGASFVLEPDPETLFAWAQTERKLGHCDRAIDLYGKLLEMDLPAENKQAVQAQIDECKVIIAEQQPTTTSVAPADPPPVAADAQAPSPPPEPEPVLAPEGRAWWKDPIGGALVGAGVAGIGLGVVFLVQARSAYRDKDAAMTYPEYEVLADRADSRGRLGVIATVAGSALVAAGIVWYVTRKPTEPALTTLVLPSGGGLAVTGRF